MLVFARPTLKVEAYLGSREDYLPRIGTTRTALTATSLPTVMLSVWAQLFVDERCMGDPEMVTGAFMNVSGFKKHVKSTWEVHCEPSELRVYTYDDEKRERPLKPNHELMAASFTYDMPLIVIAPTFVYSGACDIDVHLADGLMHCVPSPGVVN